MSSDPAVRLVGDTRMNGWLVSVIPDRLREGGALTVFGTSETEAKIAETGDCVVFFDGVLFDRNDLPGDGLEFARTWSDAQIVARAFQHVGPSLLGRLRGVFALVVWDRRQGLVVCTRDPLGAHPLFRADVNGEVLVAASIERLLAHPRLTGDLNTGALIDSLCHIRSDAEETSFVSVRRIPIAHLLRVSERGARVERFWSLGDSPRWLDEDELAEFDPVFEQAVRRHLDLGPTGIYLSGGFDSVSIAAIATDLALRRGDPVPLALSLGFPHPDANEEPVQRLVAATLGTPHVLYPFDQAIGEDGLVGSQLALNATWPEPMLNPWRWAYMELDRAARERDRDVILTGGGGDEWLTVTPEHLADLLRAGRFGEAWRFGGALLRSYRLTRIGAAHALLWRNGLRPLAGQAGRRLLGGIAPQAVRAKRRADLRKFTPPWIASRPEARRILAERMERRIDQRMAEPEPTGSHGFYLREIERPVLDVNTSLENEENFVAGSRTGVRILHPYWDPDLVSFLSRVPPRLLISDGRDKGLVRAAVDRRFPQAGFRRQRKVMAGEFLYLRLREEAPEWWKRLGGVKALDALGIVDGPTANSLFARAMTGHERRTAHQAWELMVVEAWARQHT